MSLFPEQLEADRIELVRCSREHVDPTAVHEHFEPDGTTTEEFRHVNLSPNETVYETRELIAGLEAKWEEGTDARYVVRAPEIDGDGDPFAGLCGLRIDWDRRVGNTGFWLRKPYWGNGLATESFLELLDLAFDHLDLDVVKFEHTPDNDRAAAMIQSFIEEYAGQHDGRIRNGVRFGGDIYDKEYYTITASQYESTIAPEPVTARSD